jgi:hypothetical protein
MQLRLLHLDIIYDSLLRCQRTSTCRRHDIDPQLYLTQLLTNLPILQAGQLPPVAARSVEDQLRRSQQRPAEPSHANHVVHGFRIALTKE